MRQVLTDTEAGKPTEELRRRGLPAGQRRRVVVKCIEADEPDLYSDTDLVERFRP